MGTVDLQHLVVNFDKPLSVKQAKGLLSYVQHELKGSSVYVRKEVRESIGRVEMELDCTLLDGTLQRNEALLKFKFSHVLYSPDKYESVVFSEKCRDNQPQAYRLMEDLKNVPRIKKYLSLESEKKYSESA